ncbi:MAG: hypothetical protein QNK23_07765 [Crocinitomicaceae bacterium]|nr:hypothetical protein [Crocinitomicaceae bacterium]
MERISIFNYEAFYLDFLEGNLNEEDTALLLAFLKENPDLVMDDESLPSFNAEDLILAAGVKQDLKQHSGEEIITLENVEFFMISHAEGLLSIEKAKELEQFVANTPELERERALFTAVYFSPDLNVVYDDKEGLKEKGIVLWPYISVAAAAGIIAFIMLWSGSPTSGVFDQGTTVAEDQEDSPELQEERIQEELEDETNGVFVDENDTPVPQVAFNNETESRMNNDIDLDNRIAVQDSSRPSLNDQLTPIQNMELRPINNILATFGNQEIQGIADETFSDDNVENTSPTRDYATTAFAEMENPIEPLTKFVQENINTEVDFRRQKKTEDKPGGFFIKIGNFQISRRH